MKRIKTCKFGYKATVFDIVLLSIIILSLSVASILYPRGLWYFLGFILASVLLIIAFFIDGAYYPIYITDKEIEYRGKKYPWSEVKITVLPASRGRAYYLIIDTRYYPHSDDLRKKRNKLPCIFLNNKRALDCILPFYQTKFFLTNGYGEIMDEMGLKNLDEIIKRHNETHD